MNIKNLKATYDINAGCPPGRIVVSHDCDVNTRTVEVFFRQGVIPLAISTDCTAKAAFVERQSNILINDNVPCTVTKSGSVLIPVDDLHRQGRFDMSIELTVTNQDGEKVLVTPFPMWITVNGSILNEAEVTEESKGTVPELLEEAAEALAEAKDYEKLDNLPAINGHTLIGDQTAEDLDLQDKLTAGENITIEDGVISAEGGGVTSYTELTDKPVISASDPNESVKPKWTLTNELDFASREFNGNHDVSGRIIISIDKLFPRFSSPLYSYDFNNIGASPFSSYNGYLNFEYGIAQVSNFPAALSGLDTSKTFFVYQSFKTTYTGDRLRYMLRKVIGQSLTGEYLEYAQFCRIRYSELSAEVVSQTDWVKLSGGGSEIVSGVVNQNGTITFTDSDGNTFTTSGSSVIGADGFSPTATVTQTQSGATITITDKDGTTTANISNGNDYVLTAQDKTDIADIVLSELPTTQGVLYGNTSN